MIKIFTLNVSEEVLNKFKDVEIHSYYTNFCSPMALIFKDTDVVRRIENANYDRINSCILELRRRKEST